MAERKDRARLVIDAPQEKIYQAFINKEAFETWLPPDGSFGYVIQRSLNRPQDTERRSEDGRNQQERY